MTGFKMIPVHTHRGPRWLFPVAAALLVLAGGVALAAHHEDEGAADGVIFKAGGLQFTVPARWIAEPPENASRAGQWRVPAGRDAAGAGEAEVVVFYFGAGLGGTPQENIAAWQGELRDADGHPVTGEVKTRTAAGRKITELVAFGAYSDPVPIPGVPPVLRTGYELAGAAVEGPTGNVYWQLTGPQAAVTALLPVFRKMIDGVKPQGAG